MPFIQIARQAELATQSPDATALRAIETTADMALQLIDSYLLSIQLQALPGLELEPVSVSATLQDTAHALSKLAKQYDCELEVHVSGKYEPVMAHAEGLRAAYAALGYAFIESVPDQDVSHKVVLGAHRSHKGLVAGMYSNIPMNADQLRRGRALLGSARQTLPGFSAHSGASVFVADALLGHMNSRLHASRHTSLSGLAATLLPSQQLALV